MHGSLEAKELTYFAHILPLNALAAMQALIAALRAHPPKHVSKQKRREMERVFNVVEAASTVSEAVATAIATAWTYDEVRKVFEHRSRLHVQVPASADYFFEHVLRFAMPEFVPSARDVCHAKVKTTGITEQLLRVDQRNFLFTDVGGQRSERRKWLFVFSGIQCVIFMAGLDEYDMTLEEDEQTNRLKESIGLFHTVTGSEFFAKSSWILFLNKSDIFKQKIKRFPLDRFFTDITPDEGKDFKSGVRYLRRKFKRAYQGKSRLFAYVTCHIDAQMTRKVFDSVRNILLRDAIEDAGL